MLIIIIILLLIIILPSIMVETTMRQHIHCDDVGGIDDVDVQILRCMSGEVC